MIYIGVTILLLFEYIYIALFPRYNMQYSKAISCKDCCFSRRMRCSNRTPILPDVVFKAMKSIGFRCPLQIHWRHSYKGVSSTFRHMFFTRYLRVVGMTILSISGIRILWS